MELKTFKLPDGSLSRLMDFTEHALSCAQTPELKPGEVWRSPDLTDEDLEDERERRAWARLSHRSLVRWLEDQEKDGPDEKSLRLRRLETELHWIFEHLAELKVVLGAGPHDGGHALKQGVKEKLGDDGAMYLDYLDDAVSKAREDLAALVKALGRRPEKHRPTYLVDSLPR